MNATRNNYTNFVDKKDNNYSKSVGRIHEDIWFSNYQIIIS